MKSKQIYPLLINICLIFQYIIQDK